jgi:hypothetical protein
MEKEASVFASRRHDSMFGQSINAPMGRVARFFSVQHTKTVINIPNDSELYGMTTKYTKWP